MQWPQLKFGERHTTCLDGRGLTQKKLATDAEIEETTLSNYKRGVSEPTLGSLLKIASTLDVRPEWLVFGSDFEPMDDEELELVEDWRKMTDAERHAFSATFHAVVEDRTALLKKTGRRGQRAKPAAVPPESPLQQFDDQELLALQRAVTRDLATVRFDSPDYDRVNALAKKLDQQVDIRGLTQLQDKLPPAPAAAADGGSVHGSAESPAVHRSHKARLRST